MNMNTTKKQWETPFMSEMNLDNSESGGVVAPSEATAEFSS